VRIEPKANGLSLIQQLRRYTQLNIVAIDTPTTSKVERANAASPTLEAQRVKLMAGVWNAGYLDEMAGFPTAKHDEYVDITGYAVQDFNNRQLTYDNSDLEQLEIIRGIRR
jgi:phage terminase large subunit-like protein